MMTCWLMVLQRAQINTMQDDRIRMMQACSRDAEGGRQHLRCPKQAGSTDCDAAGAATATQPAL